MEKIFKFVGATLLVGLVIFGVLYLLNITGITNNLKPEEMLGQLIGGFQDALNGIQVSISRMFSNFTN